MAGWTKGKPKSIDDYLSKLDSERRAALEKLRQQILKVLPEAEPCISYAMPAFRVGGKVVAGFLGASHGCSYYPFSGQTLGSLAAELEGYAQTKSALHFDTRRGLPLALVRKLLSVRIAETQSQASPRRVKKVAKRSSKKR